MENQTQTPFQAAVKPGITIGLISMVIIFLAYFIDSTLLTAWWLGLGTFVIIIALVMYFGGQYRTELGGFMSFGTAFNFAFVTLIIAGLLSTLGQILLYQVIDPELPQVLSDAAFEMSLSMMEKMGANPDALSPEQLDEIKKSSSAGFTLVGQLKSFGIGIIINAIIALILGAILKRRDKSLDY